MKKIIVVFFLVACQISFVTSAFARTEGFFFGGGYNQPAAYTWKSQSTIAPNPGQSITLWPGFGAFIEGGYNLTNPDWLGFAVPLTWGYTRLNKTEWIHWVSGDGEIQFHMLPPDRKFDFFLSGLIGFSYMTEGKLANQSSSLGPEFGGSLGFNYTIWEYALAGNPKIHNLSFTAELPIKLLLIINDYDLSNSSLTPIMTFPARFGIMYTF